jgi:hypothetical protein
MAANPNQTLKDLNTPSPYVPTSADAANRLTQLRSRFPQPDLNPPPTPQQPEPPRATSPQPPTHPELEEAALHGPAGRIVNCLAPHTEAHPAALLLQFLAAFGNLIGPGPHCMVESTRHALNLFVILVGDSSKARKGTSWNLIANLFADVDPAWLSTHVNSARLTANGLVRALRDQQPPTDRRLLALSEEFATVVHSLKRGNGHLSPLLRCAWDSGNLPTLDMHHQLRATGTHLSLVAHITQRELTQTFQREQVHNGFANRCLWTWVERSNCLPGDAGAPADELSAIAETLRSAVAWATARPEILFRRDQEAQQLWADCYESLSYRDPGLRGVGLISLLAQSFSRMKAPAGGLISLFSHKVHSFFQKLRGVRNATGRFRNLRKPPFPFTSTGKCTGALVEEENSNFRAGLGTLSGIAVTRLRCSSGRKPYHAGYVRFPPARPAIAPWSSCPRHVR